LEVIGYLQAPDRFDPGESAPDIHLMGDWVGSRDGLDAMEKRKILYLLGIEPWLSSS
jgi:hypothetical protein